MYLGDMSDMTGSKVLCQLMTGTKPEMAALQLASKTGITSLSTDND
jgi:hypothetical protein